MFAWHGRDFWLYAQAAIFLQLARALARHTLRSSSQRLFKYLHTTHNNINPNVPRYTKPTTLVRHVAAQLLSSRNFQNMKRKADDHRLEQPPLRSLPLTTYNSWPQYDAGAGCIQGPGKFRVEGTGRGSPSLQNKNIDSTRDLGPAESAPGEAKASPAYSSGVISGSAVWLFLHGLLSTLLGTCSYETPLAAPQSAPAVRSGSSQPKELLAAPQPPHAVRVRGFRRRAH